MNIYTRIYMDQKQSFEDLLLNESFIKWVKTSDYELNIYWEQWIKHNQHRRQDIILAKEIVSRMTFKNTLPSEETTKKIFNRIVENLDKDEKDFKYKKLRSRSYQNSTNYYLKLVAVFLILLLSMGIVYVLHQQNVLYQQQISKIEIITRKNPSSIRSKIKLPDGTKVWLNAASEITYPEKFSTVRKVQLKGEAYFEVVRDKDSPFIVETHLSKVKVLGTSFNIKAYGDDKENFISLLTGRVRIAKTLEGEEFLLSPGEQLIINRENGLTKKAWFDKRAVIGWTEGYLAFKDANKDEIINKLERWYDVKIVLLNEPSEQWDVNGYFRDQSLELVLDRLAFSKDFIYKIEGRKVTIEFK